MYKKGFIRFDVNFDFDTYEQLLKLQVYYSDLFNKKVTLKDVLTICIQSESENNKEELTKITLD